MLINSVVMFLRELLPLLLLLSVLLFWLSNHRLKFISGVAISSIVGVFLLTSQFSRISAMLDGQGLELLYAVLYLLTTCLLAVSLVFYRHRNCCVFFAAVSCSCLSLIHGANLVLYLWFYQRTPAESQSLILGAAMAMGIGLSVAVLLYYLSIELQRFWRWTLPLLLALLGARQVSMAVAILIQTDFLPAGPVVWDSQQLINEQSEYGYFLNALLGYEATPGVTQLGLFGLSVLVLLALGRRLEILHAREF